jgi:hypothetical protein
MTRNSALLARTESTVQISLGYSNERDFEPDQGAPMGYQKHHPLIEVYPKRIRFQLPWNWLMVAGFSLADGTGFEPTVCCGLLVSPAAIGL